MLHEDLALFFKRDGDDLRGLGQVTHLVLFALGKVDRVRAKEAGQVVPVLRLVGDWPGDGAGKWSRNSRWKGILKLDRMMMARVRDHVLELVDERSYLRDA